MNPRRTRAQSASGVERDRGTPAPRSFAIPPASSQHPDTQLPFLYTRSDQPLHSDPFDDLLRTMAAAAYEPQPAQHHHPSTSQYPTNPHPHLPPPQVDPNTLAWLQLLQAQSQGHAPIPPPGFNPHNRGEGTSTNPATIPAPSDDGNAEDDDEHSEGDRSMITEDKRRRNTAASARFRNKKKQWVLNLERTVTSLTRRVEELDREASDLRRENGWLKEIVMLKTSRATGPAGSKDDRPESEENESADPSKGGGSKGKGRAS